MSDLPSGGHSTGAVQIRAHTLREMSTLKQCRENANPN